MSRRVRSVVVLIVSLAGIATVQAQTTWHVDDDNCPGPGSGTEPDPFCKIQDGIDAAVDGDEVVVAAGRYTETAVNYNGKAIKLLGPEGPEVTIIDGSGSQSSVLTCEANLGPETSLEGFTITGGFFSSGGGFKLGNAAMTVTNCIFTGNLATRGGGMFINGASPIITQCVFSQNTAVTGGGLYVQDSTSSQTITDCTFVDNWAIGSTDNEDGGGGMKNASGSTPTVINCTFRSNWALAGGGGMKNHNASPTVTNCLFVENSGYGGGMYNYNQAHPVVTNCIFERNNGNKGAGMYNRNSTVVVRNSIFLRNTALSAGGGLSNFPSATCILSNCTFAENTAGQTGGGMDNFVINSVLELSNCIVWGNSSPDDQQLSGPAAVAFSDIEGGWEGEGNIDTDPLFVDPDNDDFHLTADSPCIDAGDPDFIPDEGETDIDGEARVAGVAVDMGADEFHNSDGVLCSADFDGSGNVGAFDLALLLGSWGPCVGCPADFDFDGDVDAADLAELLGSWGPCD